MTGTTTTLSEREPHRTDDFVRATVGEQHADVQSRIEVPDPESSTGGGGPASGRLAVQIDPADGREAKHADVEREDQGKFRDGDPQLCASVDRSITNVPVPLFRPE